MGLSIASLADFPRAAPHTGGIGRNSGDKGRMGQKDTRHSPEMGSPGAEYLAKSDRSDDQKLQSTGSTEVGRVTATRERDESADLAGRKQDFARVQLLQQGVD